MPAMIYPWALYLLLSWLPVVAMAEIVIDRTRVIYPATVREVTVNLLNEADSPRVVQAWTDTGDADARPEASTAPFTLTPPIVRMEAGQSRALRLVFNPLEGENLPAGTESVFWLNILSIRPTPMVDDESNRLQLAFRTRVKVFFRPSGLSMPASESAARLQWRWAAEGESAVVVRNPTAYHMTLSSLELVRDGIAYVSESPPMVAPGETLWVPLRETASSPAAQPAIRFTILDDYGATQSHQGTLASGA